MSSLASHILTSWHWHEMNLMERIRHHNLGLGWHLSSPNWSSAHSGIPSLQNIPVFVNRATVKHAHFAQGRVTLAKPFPMQLLFPSILLVTVPRTTPCFCPLLPE